MNQSFSSNSVYNENFRLRKNYFACSKSQRNKNKQHIRLHSHALEQFCNTIGLKIKNIVLEPNEQIDEDNDEIKIIIDTESKEYKIFKWLKAKDLSNISIVKYKLFRKTLNYFDMPGIRKVIKMQKALDDFFPLKLNNDGFFVEPAIKLKYVCEKFLERNPNINIEKFNIKLSADSSSVSRTKINILLMTFDLLDDLTFLKKDTKKKSKKEQNNNKKSSLNQKMTSSVDSIFILGTHFFIYYLT